VGPRAGLDGRKILPQPGFFIFFLFLKHLFCFTTCISLLPLAKVICTFICHLVSATFIEISPHYCSSALSLLSLFLLVCCAASFFHIAVFADCVCSSFCCSLRRRFLLPMCCPGSALSSISNCQPSFLTLYLPVCGPTATSLLPLLVSPSRVGEAS